MGRLKRSLRDMSYGRALARGLDGKPLQCSIYVTDRCNLDCKYCSEHDNLAEHPPLDDLKAWLLKVRDLGTMRVALVGGEPLLHPDIVEIVRYCRRLGFSTSMTTNGFLLGDGIVGDLEAAGLDVMQVSVDRITPSDVTKKAIRTIEPKIESVMRSKIKLHLTGVICEDTLDECGQVFDYGISRGIPTEIRLVHADPGRLMRVDPGRRGMLLALIRSMAARRGHGEKIHTSKALLDYQAGALMGLQPRWTCAGGYKMFFVSSKGMFMECSMRPTPYHIADVTPHIMRSYFRGKKCQEGCGIYCVINISMFYENPLSFAAAEAGARVRQVAKEIVRLKG